METLLQDLRFAVRSLRRTPAFPLAAIATLALGIGGTTASSRIYEVSASDPTILGAATVVVVIVAIVATIIPAWRISRIAPSRVLRAE